MRGRSIRAGAAAALLACIFVGVRTMEFDPSYETGDFKGAGLEALARSAGIARSSAYSPTTIEPTEAFMLRRIAIPGDPGPCAVLDDGRGIYLVLGNPVLPFEQYRLYCPTREPKFSEPGA